MGVIEAARAAAEINERIKQTGITREDERRRDAPEITLRIALEQHCIQALDPRQRKVSPETAAGYANMLGLHAPRWLDMPISSITRQMVNEKIKSMSDKPTTAGAMLRTMAFLPIMRQSLASCMRAPNSTRRSRPRVSRRSRNSPAAPCRVWPFAASAARMSPSSEVGFCKCARSVCIARMTRTTNHRKRLTRIARRNGVAVQHVQSWAGLADRLARVTSMDVV